MNNINIYSCGGESVILAEGVSEEQMLKTSEEIIKNQPLSVQVAFIRSTEIKIPRVECAENYFCADCALCFAAFLNEKSERKKEKFTVSSSGLNSPFTALIGDRFNVSLELAAKAKTRLSGEIPSVIFGGCEYFIIGSSSTEKAQKELEALAEKSGEKRCALLIKNEDKITPFFYEKGSAASAFSSGSAAIALAFLESEQSRDLTEKTYIFPKGERTVKLKRYLSEAFDARITAQVKTAGINPENS